MGETERVKTPENGDADSSREGSEEEEEVQARLSVEDDALPLSVGGKKGLRLELVRLAKA